jgi:hypothetical protein
MMPPTNRPKAGVEAGVSARASGRRSIVTSLLLIMLAVMIVRDILVRKWGSERRPLPDVTERAL